MVDVTNIVPPVNVDYEEDEITDKVFELRRKELTVTHPTPSTGSSEPKQSARLTPPVPVPSTEKADEMILQDMIQVSLADHKSHEEQEARENVVARQILYASDDDEIPTKQVSQDIIEEISLTIDEAKKEILVSPHPRKITPLVQSCQRDPEALTLSLINQDLLYLKKGNSGPEKIISLHKFLAIVFNDDDIEERTSKWVNKCIKKFNPYARYVFIRSSVIWERVHDFQLGIESYQQKINLTAPTITFPRIEEYDVFSIVYKPVHGVIYTNRKKEKRVMRPSEIQSIVMQTLRRMLEDISVNVMPRNTFEYLRLANMRNTNMLVEMADMTKNAPLDVHRDSTYWWHDHRFEEKEHDEMGIEIEKYDPPEV
ncbi:hypothetical protein Tco_0977944 [Tanacetum coccineum]|uniref:Uncharacterized protein n=1 Tax=Tanacetum coccineum TaxID=301880 RepID=A0ABQ5ELZ3_9ASTR